jgi:pimeloyl-ACP methyl ester carboxylesterase
MVAAWIAVAFSFAVASHAQTGPGRADAAQALEVPDPARALAGHWSGHVLERGRRFPVAIDLVSAGQDAVALVDYPDVPVYAAPFVVDASAGGVTLTRRPPGGPDSTIELILSDGRLGGSFSGAGVAGAPIVLDRGGDAPVVLRETPVSFRNGNVRLEGTLAWPNGNGPFPAVVISHGSGPGHREQALYRTDAFRYARLGVAALVYDKRGCGSSSGDWETAGLDDLARDALAGVALLRATRGIRADAIGVAGHSQGGWIAPLAATLSGDVAFVVATAASGLGPMAQSLYHNANEMRAAGFAPEAVERAQALRERLYQRVRTGKFDADFERDLAAVTDEPWFAASQLPTPPMDGISDGERRLLLFEPVPVWRQVRVPVLAIWGTEDINLPAERSRDLVAEALASGGNPRASLHLLPGLTHGFMKARGPDEPWDFPRGDPAVEAIVAAWIRDELGAAL